MWEKERETAGEKAYYQVAMGEEEEDRHTAASLDAGQMNKDCRERRNQQQ